MAGRPKTMLKRVAAIEERAFELAVDVCQARPQQYAGREGDEGDDEFALWWNRAAREVQMASIALNCLLTALEEKAGLGEDPERKRLEERGLLPSEEPETEKVAP